LAQERFAALLYPNHPYGRLYPTEAMLGGYLGDDYLTGYVRHVLSVTPDQVQRMTQLYLRPERMQLVVVGDKKVVQEQLAPWGTIVP